MPDPIIDPEPTLSAEEFREVRRIADKPLTPAEEQAVREARAIERANADLAAIRADEARNGSTRPAPTPVLGVDPGAGDDHSCITTCRKCIHCGRLFMVACESKSAVECSECSAALTLCDDRHARMIKRWAWNVGIAVAVLSGIALCWFIVAARTGAL